MKLSKTARVIGRSLVYSALVSVGLFIVRVVSYHSYNYWYLNWNLILAALPLFFALCLARYLVKNPWYSWQGVLLTLLCLGFLPNSFYIGSDFIHVQYTEQATLLFDIVLLLSFTINGLIYGYISVYLIHKELLKRFRASTAHWLVGLLFLACSFAIYIGRYLRWSTWDVLVNPTGILFDVSERFLNPAAHTQTFETTALFFAFLAPLYIIFWRSIEALKNDRH